MVTYSDLIQTGILIVGIIALFMQANKRSNRRTLSQIGDYFKHLVGG